MAYKKFIRQNLKLSIALTILFLAAPAVAGNPVSLEDALSQAYARKPELHTATPALRMPDSINEDGSGYLPTLNGESYSFSPYSDDVIAKTEVDPKTYALELTQPIYRKEAGLAGLQVFDNTNKAQRAMINVKQQELATQVVRSYAAVMRDIRLTALGDAHEQHLSQKVSKSLQAYNAGKISKGDLIASQIALVDAQTASLAAKRSLKKSNKELEKLTGLKPSALMPPTQLPALPATLEEALIEAEKKNPQLLYAQSRSAAAQAQTRSIDGALSPQIDLNGSMGRTYDSYAADTYEDDRVIGLRATIPFFSGATGGERMRQSRGIEIQRRQEAQKTIKLVREKLIAAWQTLTAAERRIASCTAEKATAQGGLDYEAKASCIRAESDKLVARYNILAATGRLTSMNLGIGSASNLQKSTQGVQIAQDTPTRSRSRNSQNEYGQSE